MPGTGSRILIRYSGDLTTKARATRRRFTTRLTHNLKDALGEARGSSTVQRTRDRIVIETSEVIDPMPLARVQGVQSIALAERWEWSSLQDLVAAGCELFREAVRDRRFAVRVHRVGDRAHIPIAGQELERALGAELAPLAARVDLTNPEVTVHIEVLAGEAFLFSERRAGPGGLPLGVEGHALVLASGGFDSAVAAWLMLKRGVDVDYLLCNLGGRAHQLEAVRVLKVLARDWSYGSRPHLHAVDFDAVTRDLQANVSQRYWQVVLKRLMLRAAEQVARERDAAAIITGDAVGQVSSQTLRNIATISEATRLPILRPLVGFNKNEILEIARKIGTYELSKQVGEYCAMVPSKPATAARLASIQSEETRLDAGLLERAVAERSVFDLRALDLDALDVPDLEAHEIPGDATVLDLRSKAAYQAWHYPDALFLDFATALGAYPSMPKDARYVIYCEFGLKSAHLAELMQRDGFEARHFKHGLGDLLAYAREHGAATPAAND
ncbi:MAG: tRNA uracil 4-sulfurtransferase ThiI [Myxococcota bacterium]